jgi:hypothetical protein
MRFLAITLAVLMYCIATLTALLVFDNVVRWCTS